MQYSVVETCTFKYVQVILILLSGCFGGSVNAQSTETFAFVSNQSASGNPFSVTANSFDITGQTLSSTNAFYLGSTLGYVQVTGNRLNLLTLKLNSSANFKLNEIVFEVANGLTVNDNITVTGYKSNQVVTGATSTFLVPGAIGAETAIDFTGISEFNDIDEIKIEIADDNSFGGIRIESITTDAAVSSSTCSMTASMTAQTNVDCFGDATGSLSVTAFSGSANYNYAWSNGTNNTNISSATNSLSGLVAGSYSVTVTDVNGCTANTSAIIIQPASVIGASATVSSAISCNGGTGSVTAAPSGGTGSYTFAWSDGSSQTTQTATGLTANTYTVTVTDANGCTATASETLSEPPVLLGGTISGN